MASWNATLNEHAGRGPKVVTIHGQSYHLTAAQEAQQGQPAQYAQFYILDTNEAMQQRVNDPRNQNLLQDVIQIVQDELMALTPYASQDQGYITKCRSNDIPLAAFPWKIWLEY